MPNAFKGDAHDTLSGIKKSDLQEYLKKIRDK